MAQPFVRKWGIKTPGPTPAQRVAVLRLYKKLLVIGKRTWPGDKEKDKRYIIEETRRLFNANKNLKFVEDIDEHIREAEARIEIGLHYKNPRPRVYTAWGHTPEQVRKAQNLSDIINPVYMTSYVKSGEEQKEPESKEL